MLVVPEPPPRTTDPEYLTEALRRAGARNPARVVNVTVMSSLKKLRSHTLRLRLDYNGPAGDAPSSVILKMGHLDGAGRSSYANPREIAFYRDVAPAVPTGVAPHCFDVVEATDTSAWHRLLEDLADSHCIATAWPLPPTFSQCESIVRAQARFHAAWWDNPLLGLSARGWRDTDAVDRDLQSFAERLTGFTSQFSEAVPPERRDLYGRLLDQAPRLLARYHSHRNLTVIHGDAHPWNFFIPRHDAAEDVRLIDWENWSID